MTDEARKKLIDWMRLQTSQLAADPAKARASLIAEGIYNANGTLAAEYGGDQPKRKSA